MLKPQELLNLLMHLLSNMVKQWVFCQIYYPHKKLIKKLLIIAYSISIFRTLLIRVVKYIKLEFRHFVSFFEIINHKVYIDSVLHQTRKEVYYSAPIFFDQIIDTKLEKGLYYQYGAVFDNVEIIGGSNLLLIDRNLAQYEIPFLNKNNKYVYTDRAIRYYYKKVCLIDRKQPIMRIDTGISLSGNFSWNYYHFLFEFIAKFYHINKANLGKDIPLIVDDICFSVDQYRELISIFNTSERDVKLVRSRDRYLVKKLFYFSIPNFIPPDISRIFEIQPYDCMFDLDTLYYLRDKLLTVKSNKQFSKRIYISRKKASNRRMFNENEVATLLSKYGFDIVYPEDYSIIDQVALFNGAEIIIGGSGAAFANIIFCNKGCRILCFVNYKYYASVFSTIAKYVGADMIYFYDNNMVYHDGSNLHDKFEISIQKLEDYVSRIVQKS